MIQSEEEATLLSLTAASLIVDATMLADWVAV